MSILVKHVCKAMERIAPLRLAESWDNVGLLLEAPKQRPNANRVLLTIDLTPAVVTEALSTPTAFIVSYHTPIFKPISSITLSNPLQASLLRCAAAGISVYVPHTALDSVTGGIHDWLCLGLNNQSVPRKEDLRIIGKEDPEGLGGLGRVLRFHKPVPMSELVRRAKSHLNLKHLQIAYTDAHELTEVRSVAVCAGSGGSVLLGVDADVYFTGEMSHHEVLAAIASDRHVILCGHDNTERGYLQVLAEKLRRELYVETHLTGSEPALEVFVSEKDKHPLYFV